MPEAPAKVVSFASITELLLAQADFNISPPPDPKEVRQLLKFALHKVTFASGETVDDEADLSMAYLALKRALRRPR